ncbi:MAG: DinB family protein [Nocardioidaceae bacterium]
MTIEPDTKDWTWVLERRCDECGFDSSTVPVDQLPDQFRQNARGWIDVLTGEDVAVRPVPSVWSPLEYACHVRDVHVLFDRRVELMLTEDAPRFENWDQDATAVDSAYGDQDPAVVATELVAAAEAVAGRYAAVAGDRWHCRGTRSEGAVFTVETLARYHLHDVVHHLYDVRS